jgi:hypothetical protein
MVMTADVIPDRPSTIHHLITIPGYSKLAQMPAASKLTLRMFRFLGEAWSIILSPNGTNKTSTDSISIMAMRHSDPENTGSGIEVAIEILDKSHKHAIIYKKQVLCDHNLCFRSILKLNKTELEAASCINEDSITIACTFRPRSAGRFLRRLGCLTFRASTNFPQNSRYIVRQAGFVAF